jgi:hypothetical protein
LCAVKMDRTYMNKLNPDGNFLSRHESLFHRVVTGGDRW